jgi:two-component system chemotaxis response regulator CheY
MRVLIIDDSRAIRVMLGRMLTDLGHEVARAPHGREALDHLEQCGSDLPDLILVDWNMPVMDGYSFLKEVRGRGDLRALTMMMVTTEVESEQMVRALAAGANEYLMKPFAKEDLLAKIELLFGRAA